MQRQQQQLATAELDSHSSSSNHNSGNKDTNHSIASFNSFELLKKLPSRPSVNPICFKAQLQKATECNLISNYYNIKTTNKIIYFYSFEINQDIAQDSREMKNAIFNKMKDQLTNTFSANHIISGFILFSTVKIEKITVLACIIRGKEFQVTFRFGGPIDISCIKPTNAMNSHAHQFICILMKKIMISMGLQPWGKDMKCYDNNKVISISNFDLQILKGFTTTVNVKENGLKMCIDFSSRILQARNLNDILMDHFNKSELCYKKYCEELAGKTVLCKYGRNLTYIIGHIDNQSTVSTKLIDYNGKQISLMSYYKTNYGKSLSDPDQPVIVVKVKKSQQRGPIFLVPELVVLAGLQEEQTANNHIMKELSRYTKLEPQQRMSLISEHQKNMNQQLETEQWGITLEPQKSIHGVKLQAPGVTFCDGKTVQPFDGVVREKPTYGTHQVRQWTIYVYNVQAGKEFYELAVQASQKLKVTFDKPRIIPLQDKTLLECLTNGFKATDELSVILLPDAASRNGGYQIVKKFFSCQVGNPSQVIKEATLWPKYGVPKGQLTKMTNILQQIMAKIGFQLWQVEAVKQFSAASTMLVGVDVFHQAGKGKSLLGFVASYEKSFSQYFSKLKVQGEGVELIKDIGNLMIEACLNFKTKNGKLPEQVIVYRDGVGAGQIKQLIEMEVSNIMEGFSGIGPNYNPKFAEIIVTKRIQDRFFTQSLSNPEPGTIVARDIVMENGFDFFLAAQKVTQGTCTPTHYQVIYNTTGLYQDDFWKLTYYQCFNYFNWQGAIRVPACVMNAHKLAYTYGMAYKGKATDDIHNNLLNKLHFL